MHSLEVHRHMDVDLEARKGTWELLELRSATFEREVGARYAKENKDNQKENMRIVDGDKMTTSHVIYVYMCILNNLVRKVI